MAFCGLVLAWKKNKELSKEEKTKKIQFAKVEHGHH